MHTKLVGSGARLRLLVVGCMVALACLSMAAPAEAAGVVGTGTPASCTEAALTAKVAAAGTVTFNCGASPMTIVLSTHLQLPANITLDGGNKITLSGNNTTFILQPFSGRTITIKNITLTRGRDAAAGAIENFATLTIINTKIVGNTATGGDGGAIHNAGGSLTISGSTLSKNLANKGGAIFNDAGPVTINQNSAILNNMALVDGGGIYHSAAALTLNGVTISDNRATGAGSKGGGIELAGGNLSSTTGLILRRNDASQGGAIYVESGFSAIVYRAEMSANTAGDGAGIYLNGGGLSLRNDTLSGNVADGRGGGLYASSGNATLLDVTINGNSADPVNGGGGGIYSVEGNVRLKDSIVSNSLTGSKNCAGPTGVVTLGYNISSDATCNFTAATDKLSTDPKLGALANNGGVGFVSFSHLPQAGSPAIDKGSGCAAPDQRGYVRVIGVACDIGSVETGSHP